MTPIDFLYIALFSGLFLSKHTTYAAKLFLSGYAVFFCFYYFVQYYPALKGYVYAFSGGIHALIFLSLCYKRQTIYSIYFFVSLISIGIVFLNIQGFMYFFNGIKYKKEYDYILTNLVGSQIIILYLKAAINGLIDRFNYKRDFIQFISDSNSETFGQIIQRKKEEKK